MDRNPINQDQVKALVESFERNRVWPNVVVRPKPGARGHYELLYGHHRLAAMIKTGMTSAEFIVQDIDDWHMLCGMIDENESQQVATPELVYENIEAAIVFLEPVVRQCSTLEEFRSTVPRGTVGTEMKPSDYSRVRNNVMEGEGLGVSFLHRELPGQRSTRRDNIQVVVDTHYKPTKAAAKEKRAAAKREGATAKRKAASVAATPAKAKGLHDEADALDVEADKLAAQARKLRDTGIDQDILMKFDSVFAMTEFAQTVKAQNIPKARHAAAYEIVEDVAARDLRRKLEAWWFVDSGRAQKQRDKAKREGWKRKYRDKSLDEFSADLALKLRSLTKEVKAVAEFAASIEAQRVTDNLLTQVNILYDELAGLAQALEGGRRAAGHNPAQKKVSMQTDDDSVTEDEVEELKEKLEKLTSTYYMDNISVFVRERINKDLKQVKAFIDESNQANGRKGFKAYVNLLKAVWYANTEEVDRILAQRRASLHAQEERLKKRESQFNCRQIPAHSL
jgi:hypothetical protein